eukprot:5877914-Prymnesium_polylepis.1
MNEVRSIEFATSPSMAREAKGRGEVGGREAPVRVANPRRRPIRERGLQGERRAYSAQEAAGAGEALPEAMGGSGSDGLQEGTAGP